MTPVVALQNARCEPRFEAAWLTHLMQHFGRWCRASDLWPPQDAYQRAVLRQRAHEVVQRARRLGLVIDADPRHGYRLTGHDGLPPYLHLHERAEDRAEVAPAPGQLSLADVVGVDSRP